MNVLSLFDGISGGQLALKKANIKYNKYYASEIDKFALSIVKKQYPNTIQLGDINDWRTWNIEFPDLIIAGSPCQGFSNCGKRLNFEDSRSKLFFVFCDILKYYKPKYFMLENVKMKKDWSTIITDYVGVEPIEINSSLVSAQNRTRLYWTNIKDIKQPVDQGLVVNDILEKGVHIFVSNQGKKYKQSLGKACALLARDYKGFGMNGVLEVEQEQGYIEPYLKFVEGKNYLGFIGNSPKQATKVFNINGKSVTLTANGGGQGGKTGLYLIDNYARKLTPLECERLQTVPDTYTKFGINEFGKGVKISNTQRYKMLGNGWTIDVISHILKNIQTV